MKGWLSHRLSMMLVAACAVSLLIGGTALGGSTWADEIWNAATFYKTTYPASDFDPYLQTLAKVREGLGRGDQQIVKVEMDRFLKMLLARAHGINDVAADELYNFTVSVRPREQEGTTAAIELGIGSERPMAVPDRIDQTRDDGKTPCEGFDGKGCDYWLDYMADYSGG